MFVQKEPDNVTSDVDESMSRSYPSSPASGMAEDDGIFSSTEWFLILFYIIMCFMLTSTWRKWSPFILFMYIFLISALLNNYAVDHCSGDMEMVILFLTLCNSIDINMS